jgi:hypothetical protein
MSKAEAFDDFIQELRKGGTPESVAANVAPFYDVNPEFLLQRFKSVYPNGLTPVNLEKANELMAKHIQRENERIIRSNEAVRDFFRENPNMLLNSGREVRKLVDSNERELKLIEGVKKALESWPCRYADRNGKEFIANRLSDVKSTMIEQGWRNVSRLDEGDMERMGFRVIEATYTQGARPTGKYIRVVVLREVEGE